MVKIKRLDENKSIYDHIREIDNILLSLDLIEHDRMLYNIKKQGYNII